MKRIFILLAGLLLSTNAMPQESNYSRHEFSLNGFGGLSTLKYTAPTKGSYSMGFGGGGGLGYTFNFTSHWGLLTGVDVSLYNSSLKGNIEVTSLALKNPPQTPAPLPGADTRFEILSSYTDYKETQSALFLNIPVMAQYSLPVFGSTKFYAAGGVRVSIPLSATYDAKATSVTHKGFYHYNNQYFLEDYGFGNTPNLSSSGDMDFSLSFMASAEAGLKWRFGDRWNLYTGLYFDYGINDVNNAKDEPVVKYNGSAVTGYNSAITNNSIHPMAAGLKLRLSFGSGRKSQTSPAPTPTPAPVKEAAPAKATPPATPVKETTPVVDESAAEVRRQADLATQKQREADEAAKKQREAEAQRAALEKEKGQAAREAQQRAASPPQPQQSAQQILSEPVDGYLIRQTTLTSSQKKKLDAKIPLLKQSNDPIDIYGHTCDIGSDAVNERIGLSRAEAVKSYLISKGISASRIKTVASKRATEPLVPNSSESNRQKNRRVEIILE